MPVWKDLEKRHGELRNLRAREEPVWRDLSLALEEDGGALDVRDDTRRSGADSFDSTALYAKDDFVGGLFTEAINPAERWFEYTLDDAELAKWGPVKQHLWDRAAITRASLDPGVDSFYIEAVPWLSDKAVYGTGFLAQEEDLGRREFISRALPVRENFKDVDANGRTDTIHREFMLTGRQAEGKWGEAAPEMREDESAQFVHALYRNDNYVEGALGLRGFPWLSCYASPDKRDFSVERGYYELPVHEVEWKRRSGRAWASGPGHKARADILMLDEMARSTLIALQFEAEPMLLAHDEDVLSAADIVPNGVVAGGMSENGKRLVDVLQRGENLHLPMTAIEQVRTAIREGFHFSLMQLVNRPQMTAAEFLGWKEEKLRLLAPHLVTIHRGLAGFINRRDALLNRAGRLPPPPPELVGRVIKIKFASPFAQAQKAASARAAVQLGNSVIQLAQLDPEAPDNVNVDNLVRKVADGLSGDPADVRDPREVAARRQQRAAAQAQDVQLQRDAQQAATIADVAHARQALTLADGRKGKAA